MKSPTLGEVMEGKGEVPRYAKTEGFYHHLDEKMEGFEVEHGTISRADFGRFCHYQGVLVGLSITINLENGLSCGKSFENMQDVQEIFVNSKATYLKDLIGVPVLVASKGMRTLGVKINTNLVVDRNHHSHADSISFFTSANLISILSCNISHPKSFI